MQRGVATTTAEDTAFDIEGLGGELAPGTYTLREVLEQLPAEPSGGRWEFTSIECDGATVEVDAPNATATIALEPGAAPTCVVTDTFVAAEVASTPETTSTTTAPAPPTDAAPSPTDDDGDGIAAAIEDAAPNGGDGNRDGLVDSRQSNVASLPAAVDVNGNGALDDYVTIVAPEATTLTNVRALEVPSDNPPPDGVRLPYGLFEYDVKVASPGDTADVTYVLPDEGVVPTSVHMLQNGVWSDYADHTSLDSADGEVTISLRDGGEGDETGAADGVIQDPSGLSTAAIRRSRSRKRARVRRRTSLSGSRSATRRPALLAPTRQQSGPRAARPTPRATAAHSTTLRQPIRGTGGAQDRRRSCTAATTASPWSHRSRPRVWT